MSDTPPVPPVLPVLPVLPVEPVVVVPPPFTPPTRPDPYAPPSSAPGFGDTPAYASPPYAAAPTTNTLAIVALIAAFFVPLAAVICGHLALSQIKRTGQGGRSLALAGTIIGYCFIGLSILVGIIYAVVIVAAVSSGNYSSLG